MYNVLVADDHAIVRSGISYLVDLQPNFTVVDGTASGTDTYMRIEQGDIDILIMDLSMPPGENGLLTTQRIHDKFPQVRIIILSMHEEQEYINKAMANGAMSYVLKSSPDTEIIKALQHVINGENYLDTNIIVSKNDLKKINASGNNLNLEGYNSLSKREKEVFPLIALGYSNKEISQKMFISTKTVEAHKANISRKLHLHGRVELVQYAIHHHLIDF
ncbi:DNA-binding response regulator [Lactobacillus sp. 0.1XD8-4]|uniref:response regulator n=1 Tax=uncultured Limosilactobacillus sp. TaxID=2837629 RepID=UPI00129DEE99|nr:response regulator transcription factor [uncultured Limosilactobacillus sp.]MRN06775.1 DNA-binding response regulator [Lactobacillus sp. 0.1XD8-4]